jgi:hypothetical protein
MMHPSSSDRRSQLLAAMRGGPTCSQTTHMGMLMTGDAAHSSMHMLPSLVCGLDNHVHEVVPPPMSAFGAVNPCLELRADGARPERARLLGPNMGVLHNTTTNTDSDRSEDDADFGGSQNFHNNINNNNNNSNSHIHSSHVHASAADALSLAEANKSSSAAAAAGQMKPRTHISLNEYTSNDARGGEVTTQDQASTLHHLNTGAHRNNNNSSQSVSHNPNTLNVSRPDGVSAPGGNVVTNTQPGGVVVKVDEHDTHVHASGQKEGTPKAKDSLFGRGKKVDETGQKSSSSSRGNTLLSCFRMQRSNNNNAAANDDRNLLSYQ